ncbi:MAG: GntR family transcriptional regulator [Actinomycetota bacterium]
MTESLSEQAYSELRDRIVRLEFAPGDVLREDALREELGIGRTPIREALQRLEREHFVNVVPRQGIFVTGIDVDELAMLFETRMVLEPYAARLAALRGSDDLWESMEGALAETADATDGNELLAIDRRCHELMWHAAGNRFLVDTLDMLYAQSDRLWHQYLSDVAEPEHAVAEHVAILEALRSGNADHAAKLVDEHVAAFDAEIRAAVTARLTAPLG